MKKEKTRRCLKFVGYIFLPVEGDNLRYYASRTPGRIMTFNEQGKPQQSRAIAFDNLGQMLNVIERSRRALVYKRVSRKKK